MSQRIDPAPARALHGCQEEFGTVAKKQTSDVNYDESKIKVLEGLEAVRKRPGMYIGDTTLRGMHHLVWEIVDNSIDEAMAGRCDKITIRINVDGSVTVSDNGSGIPVGPHPQLKISTLEVVMCKLHAGGKFDHDTYKVSGGLHGVGASVVNALSEWCEVEVAKDGTLWRMEFERGHKASELKKIGERKASGTTVTFKPDPQIFPDTTFKYEVLLTRVRELAYLNEGLTLGLQDERDGRKDEFRFDQGLMAFVKHLNEGKETLHPPVVIAKADEATNLEMSIVFQYNDGYNETLLSFANNIHTLEGGTHLSGFRTALTRTLNFYAKQQNLLKKEAPPSGDDLREGLTAVVTVRVSEPQFEGQTKTKLGNSEVESFVVQSVNELLSAWLEEHPPLARKIVNKGIAAMQARTAARKARDLARRKGALASGNLPGKLADCRSRDRDRTEIFLVEGDSAGGPAKQGRDSAIQAILPLRGKILNVEKARIDKMLSHEEIRHIISALGCGIGADEFNLGNRRYGKIIIMTDADVDGSHIRTLLLTFFYRHMRPLIANGHVFVAQPPLYLVTRRRHKQYVLNEAEMRKTLLDLGLEGTTLTVYDTSGRKPKSVAEFNGARLRDLATLLGHLADNVAILERRGLDFADMLARRDAKGNLPGYWALADGQEHFFYGEEDYDAFLAQFKPVEGETAEQAGQTADAETVEAGGHRLEVHAELHEIRDIQKIIERLRGFDLSIDDYYLVREESVTGEKEPAKFVFASDGDEAAVDGLAGIVPGIRELGSRGMEIKRFKGLGEMNDDQLWETTMDPARRVLLRVRAEDAEEAERMFTVLMGANVEKRREFIEDHALEVKNLDV
ncbi:MAG: DNA topoisomerase (ATP-hydrolyzing) subunit B [Planctomycetes bacterium]|nr:DNA topoisomerase (ATP-hydrolyzing) subunit B [Planctomycetota bacterium]